VTTSQPTEVPAVRSRQKRRPFRRDQILDIAIELFYERGYHATGMDDIGRAAGITGPGIYRHFKSKEDILNAAMQEGIGQILGKVHEIVENSATPEETLQGLVRNFIRAVLNKPALAALLLNERRMFPPDIRASWDRASRLHMEEWAHALSQVRRDLDEGEIQLTVNATAGLLTSVVSFRSGLDRARLEDILQEMAAAALLGADDRPTRERRTAQMSVLKRR
jgi:AcrR family transcriptional regulator